jgi:hypothetical protein
MGRTIRRRDCLLRQRPVPGLRCERVFVTDPNRAPRPATGLIFECVICGRRYAYDYRKGHTKRKCNTCRSNERVDRDALKREMVRYKGGRCQACGYDRCLRALCFHHSNAGLKRFNFAGSHLRSRKSLWAELDKCVLLCMNSMRA